MLGKGGLMNKSYKKKIGKKNNGPVDYMKDVPLMFEMDDVPYKEQVSSVKKNSFVTAKDLVAKQFDQEF